MTFAGVQGDDARDRVVQLLEPVGQGDQFKHKLPQISEGSSVQPPLTHWPMTRP